MKWGLSREEFKGEWRNDQRVKGVMKMVDGSVYDGEWKNDVMHGIGKLYFKSNSKK
jgi:hypothetical protein